LTTKTKVISVLLITVTAYAFGRWSAPEKIVEKRVEVVRVDKSVDTNKDQRKEVVKHTVTKPDGTTETTETTVTDTKKKTEVTVSTEKNVSTEKTVTFSTSKVTIMALVGSELSLPLVPIYGLSITKPVLGPVTAGAWGFSNRTFGVSVGLTF